MLNIHIASFSYAKGVPTPPHEHGCGFVFDCRGVDNPSLLPELTPKTGLDAEIEGYLISFSFRGKSSDQLSSGKSKLKKKVAMSGFSFSSFSWL